MTQTCKHHDIKYFPNHQIKLVNSRETVPTTSGETTEEDGEVELER